jgi:5-methylcytosine-specific restriction endonuclease McrA
MGVRKDYFRHSKAIIRTRRWKALRLEVLRRDDWKCRQCGSKRHLQVDHIEPVRNAPTKAFEPLNLQTLCRVCHSSKTRREVHGELPPERQAWKNLVMET